jgi:hypothetical protein
MEDMRILLKFILDCEPDTAWRAIRSPAVFRAVSAPFTTFESLEPGGFPKLWSAGVHPVRGKAFGLLPMGDQVIDISFGEARGATRLVHDDGGGLSGLLTLVTDWHHTMAVSPTADGRTLYRDQLRFRVGPITLLAWPLYWVFWQWRGARIRSLALSWKA